MDTLCLDKTGTITEGTMQVDELVPFAGVSEQDMAAALSALVSNLSDGNPTSLAIQERFPEPSPWRARDLVPFSSARKWSGAFFPAGAPTSWARGNLSWAMAFPPSGTRWRATPSRGQRVLLLACSPQPLRTKSCRRSWSSWAWCS